jgi:hypothetical protein
MRAYTPVEVEIAQRELDITEAKLCREQAMQKVWISVVDPSLKMTEHLFTLQRIGCEPPVIRVSLEYVFSVSSPDKRKLKSLGDDFRLKFVQAMRQAITMSHRSVFLNPNEAKAIDLAASNKAKVTALRDSKGMLPDRFFIVQHIAVVTELISGTSVAIQQSPHLPEVYDIVREGKRQLSEKILKDDILSDAIDLAEHHRIDPIPTGITMSVREGEVYTTVSYDALGGNIQPLEAV